MTIARRSHAQLMFLAAAIAVNVVASRLAHGVTDPARHRMVAIGATFDMTVTVTGLYYWLVVRPGFRPWPSLFPVAFLGLLRASFAVPDVVPKGFWIGAGAEFALMAALVFVVRRGRTNGPADPVERIGALLASAIPFATAARALAGELSILYYAFAWRAKPDVPPGARAFSLHKRSGAADLITLIGIGSLLEAAPVHLVIGHWDPKLAWLMTALSLYGGLWAVALGRSFALRPTLVSEREILVRHGLLFSLRIPVECIRAIRREGLPGALVIPRKSSPARYIEFTRPLEAQWMFGFTKHLSAIGLSADDQPAFADALREAFDVR